MKSAEVIFYFLNIAYTVAKWLLKYSFLLIISILSAGKAEKHIGTILDWFDHHDRELRPILAVCGVALILWATIPFKSIHRLCEAPINQMGV